MLIRRLILSLLLLGSFISEAVAVNTIDVVFTLEEIISSIKNAKTSNNPLSKILADKIYQEIQRMEQENGTKIILLKDSILLEQQIGDLYNPVNPCDKIPVIINVPDLLGTGIRSGYGTGIIAPETSLRMSVRGSKIRLGTDLEGSVNVNMDGYAHWGLKYFYIDFFTFEQKWGCYTDWEDRVDLNVKAVIDASIDIVMDIGNFSAIDNTFVITNNFRVEGKVSLPEIYENGVMSNPDITIGNNIRVQSLTELLFRELIKSIEFNKYIAYLFTDAIETDTQKRYNTALANIQDDLANKYGSYEYIVHFPSFLDSKELIPIIIDYLYDNYGYRDQHGLVESLYNFIEQHMLEIIVYLVTDNKEALEKLLIEGGCAVIGNFEANISPQPLYYNNRWRCRVASSTDSGFGTGTYYSDRFCTTEVPFRPMKKADFCAEAFEFTPRSILGNANHWTPDIDQVNDPLPDFPSQKWTVSPGTKMDLLALSLDPLTDNDGANNQPYMKRVQYRSINVWYSYWSINRLRFSRPKGCYLEMRVYKKDINETDLQPLMLLHGGSWTYRSPFYGLEASISHYTDAGFAVFVPFYRVVGDGDGGPDCNNASWRDIVNDVEAALDWVKMYGSSFGAIENAPVSLLGQSAGGHLAAWLATHRAADINRAVLMYPFTDVIDFVKHMDDIYAGYKEDGIKTLSLFFGVDISGIDIDNPPSYAIENSFPNLVTSATPPMFIIHGIADTVVPSNQSVNLCNSFGGVAINDGGGVNLRAIYDCGSVGKLHLFEEGQHGLEACLDEANELCLSGSAQSKELVADSLQQAKNWLVEGKAEPCERFCFGLW